MKHGDKFETIEVMRDLPHIAKEAKEARRDYMSGKWKKYISLDELLDVFATKRDMPNARFVSHKKAWVNFID
ncbi:MAG: hypothetical protein HY437_02580 [Candidatus Magasanikbacteria bacterium]|nr:hypothetical protein [Candidatus Magasanikbacteria bacterium]